MVVHENRVLLPQQLTPVRYNVELSPDLVNFTFGGKVVLHTTVNEAASSVQLHARELSIKTAHVVQGGKKIEVPEFSINLAKEILTLQFAETLSPGEAEIHIAFDGILNDQMAGFYRSSYKDINGNSKIMATTQFESIDARRAFPCWDEPAAKAIFEITLVVDQHLTAISNMPEASNITLSNGKRRVVFMPTVKMSTYLIAFVVGELDCVAGVTKHGVPIRCFATPGQAGRLDFALDTACRTLDIYDDYFGQPYPLPKLDMIAIPDFAAGAMENWGLVTYREVDLLIDPPTATIGQLIRVCTVVTHELAHQWFGNLVTMAWWSGLWLNESFACFMQTWAAHQLHPEWKLWEHFISHDMGAALRLDSLRSSHPIQVPIQEAKEVEEVFDAISYCKGATVVRMIAAVIGEEAFQKGLQIYFKRHQYGNTEGSDLWAAWSEACGKDINALAASWTEQMGFPLLRVARSEEGGKVKLTLRQTWFLADGSEVKPEEQKTWQLPVFVRSASREEPTLLMMTSAEESFIIEGAAVTDWVKVNANHTTPMRVLYDDTSFKGLLEAVSSKALNVADRVGLLLDYHSLVQSNYAAIPSIFRLLKAYSNEDDAVVWDALSTVLMAMHKVLRDHEMMEQKMRAMASDMVDRAFATVGWDTTPGESALTRAKRTRLVELLAKFSRSEDILATARRKFEAVLEDLGTSECPPDYRVSLYSMVLKNGDATTYDQLMSLYERSETNAQRVQVLHAIGFAPTQALKRRTLDWTTTKVKLQDFFYPINSVASSSHEGQVLAWTYFQENFERLREKLAQANQSLMHAVIVYSCRGFNSRERVEEVANFFGAHPVRGVERGIQQMLEGMRVNVAFVERLLASEVATEEFWTSL